MKTSCTRLVGRLAVAGCLSITSLVEAQPVPICTTADAVDGGVGDCDTHVPPAAPPPPPPPPPWIPPATPAPQTNPDCSECITTPTTSTSTLPPLPPIGNNWPDAFGPGLSAGFYVTFNGEKTTTKNPCACFEQSSVKGGASGSLTLGKYGGQVGGSYAATDTECQTPMCTELEDFTCAKPSGFRTTSNWSAYGGLVTQIPWEAMAPSLCASPAVSCNGELALNVSASGGKDRGAGDGYCSPCANGVDLANFSLAGSLAGRGEIEVGIPWVVNVQVGVEIEGGLRYRNYNGNNCGIVYDESSVCGWARGRVYGNACLSVFCIDGEREIFSVGESCRTNMPPGVPLPARE